MTETLYILSLNLPLSWKHIYRGPKFQEGTIVLQWTFFASSLISGLSRAGSALVQLINDFIDGRTLG